MIQHRGNFSAVHFVRPFRRQLTLALNRQRTDRLAASIPNFKFIKLQDGSSLFFCDNRIDLASLKILTSENAESWYGSLGYNQSLPSFM